MTEDGHCSKCGQPVATACSLCWALFCLVCDIDHKKCEKPKELEASFDPVRHIVAEEKFFFLFFFTVLGG